MDLPDAPLDGPCVPRRSDVEPLGIFFRRLHRQGRSLVVAVPPVALRALGVVTGDHLRVTVDDTGRVILDAWRGRVETIGRFHGGRRGVADLARRVVKLERKLARAYHSGVAEGYTLGYCEALSTGVGPLGRFLADYHEGRVFVLPVEAPASKPPSSG